MYLGATPKVWRGRLSPGKRGTVETLGLMRKLVDQARGDVSIREAALGAVRAAGVRAHDFAGELGAVFGFVRDRVRFVRDPEGIELLQTPQYTLAHLAGDCDDKSTLLVSMLRSIGNPAALRFRAVGETPSGYSHVYPVAQLNGRTIPLDATREGTPIGWQLERPALAMDFPT